MLASVRPDSSPRLLPVLRARVTGVQGKELNLASVESVRERGNIGREFTVTYRDHLQPNERIVEGDVLDDAGDDAARGKCRSSAACATASACRSATSCGSTFSAARSKRASRASAKSTGAIRGTAASCSSSVPTCSSARRTAIVATLKGPADQAARARLQRDVVAQFPNVSVIDLRDVLRTVEGVLSNVTFGISIVGGVALVSGLLILIGAVAMTKFQRLRDVALLKTLGATSRVIVALLASNTACWAVAGAVGAIGASILSWVVSTHVLDIQWRLEPLTLAAAVVLTAVIVGAAGVLSSVDVLRRKPLAVLRGAARRHAGPGPGSGVNADANPGIPSAAERDKIFRLRGLMEVAGNQSMDTSFFREILMRRRKEILDSQKPLATSMVDTNTRQGDLADQATGNNEVHIHLKLKQTDAKILQAIEEALKRLEHGHLRHLPRLRRADRGGAAQRDSVDPRVHQLQGEAESVSPDSGTARSPAGVLSRSPGVAAPSRRRREGRIADYEFNNTYQYVIAREEIHVQWVRDAIVDLGGEAPADRQRFPSRTGKGLALRARSDRRRHRQGARSSTAGARSSSRCERSSPQACSRSCSARCWSTSASSSRPRPAATTCSAAACRAPAPATACCPFAGCECDPSVRVAIALGSNLGDRRHHLEAAIDLLMPHLRQALVSSFLETPAGRPTISHAT